MRRFKPWVKKAVLVTVIIVAVGAGLSIVAGTHGRDVGNIVRVSQEFHGSPVGSIKGEMRGGESAAVPAPRGGEGTMPAQVLQLREGGIHIEPRLDQGVGTGVVLVGGTILIVGLLLLFMRKRGRQSRIAEGSSVLAGIPSASDFLDQWEIQQNQTKESK
ncbi:hypothetical protein [Paenibacillus glycanilyticus]|uniref:LPXTG cell wall anchor domain-containing protein n=1 Tax=Paenibacillus glycanilyticus TaxID=126569 RepID=A0ABQ6GL71_9BACL|nr:hypothetical protein [Paenibacillus glycanilyticus]GLX71003.1 hypothetical protein MU1_53510 [Paenibacillus glycanilyticus]